MTDHFTDVDTRQMSIETTTSTAHRLPDYDGACAHIHGHNMAWSLDVTVDMDAEVDGMVVDLKDLKAVVERYDHALVLHATDPLVNHLDAFGEMGFDIVTTDGAPTCECLSQVVADDLVTIPGVISARVGLAETAKYSVSATATDDDWWGNEPL